MDNQYPIGAFYFSLSFTDDDSDSVANFKEISGISTKKKDDVSEGESANNSQTISSTSTTDNLILKRGVILYDTPLFHWCSETFENSLGEPLKPRNIYISLLDEYANVLKTWKVLNAWPVKISISELASIEHEIAIETLEFAFSSLESV